MLKKLRQRKWQKIIKNSGLFDLKYYLFTYPDVRQADIDPIKHYVQYGVDEGRNPSAEFNTKFYLKEYKDIHESKINPFVHYILYGKEEERISNNQKNKITSKEKSKNKSETELNEVEKSIIEYINIHYKQKFSENLIELNKFIQTLDTQHIYIENIFDAKLYLDINKDLKQKNVNPLLHYLKHGLKENRMACIDKKPFVVDGKIDFFDSKDSIVFVSHESSATGAPLLGYSIIDELNNKFNIIHIIITKKQDTIHQVFIDNCFMAIENIEKNPYLYTKYLIKHLMNEIKISCVVCNSVVCRPVLQAAYELKLPTLTLIHEFSDYTRPLGTIRKIVEYSDNVIAPANIIKDSIYEDILGVSSAKRLQKMPKNIHVSPQGKLPYIPDSHGENDSIEELKRKLAIDDSEEYKVIVGSGWVQIRKGVDLFVAAAKKIKQKYHGKCKFVWVGEGYEPLTDFSFSIWLQREIKYSGLGDDFIFLDHQKNLDNIFQISDLFCLSSRMDPFPNVVIDALEHDLPIVCFEHTTGSSEFLLQNKANCYVADHLDVNDLANGAVELLNTKPNGMNKKLVKEKLNFTKYVNELEKYIDNSIKFNNENKKITNALIESNQFDPVYYNSDEDSDYDKCFKYVSNTRKGLHDYSPKAGFSQGKWLVDNKLRIKDTDAILNDLQKNIETHDAKILANNIENNNIYFRYAVHLHLYYVDLADDFVSYFKNLPGDYDLFITTVDQNVNVIKKIFENCGARNIKVKNVKNIGRDFGPMLFALNEEILSGRYEVIGHFHSKKSFDINDNSGNTWRRFLLDTLIGDKGTSNEILSLFNNKEIGLVFPDDRHLIDIGENKKYVDEVCDILSLSKIDETPLFPIGNMFWARVEAIKPLFLLDKKNLLQEEPLPYDGSYMHALERITPTLVENRNFKYITVSKRSILW